MQMRCEQCANTTFYIMAQEDGSIEAFCTQYNHKNLLVNIPELVQNILGGVEEILPDAEKLKVTVSSIEEGVTDVSIQRDPIDTTGTESGKAR